MFRRIISLTLVLMCLLVFAACASRPGEITGTIESAKTAFIGNRLEIVLTLEGRPETFVVHLSDVHKFGMTKVEKPSTSADLSTMFRDIDATKGWKVKLTCEKTKNQQGPEYLVKNLEKLSGK